MYNMRAIDLNAKYKTPNIDALTKQEAKLSLQKENSKNNEEPFVKSQIPPRTQMSYEIRSTAKYIEPDTKISTENRAKIWAMILKNNKHSSKLAVDDNEILRTVLKLPNQRVIKSDCSRTRASLFDDKLKESLEYLITYYCIKENVTYKQGLNEVVAPFVFFMKSGLQISTVYNYFALFMERFLPNIFTDQDFLSMQCCFRILVVLIKYHDPQLYHFLKINDLPPELYATPWFLTLFASKLSIDMVLLLWDSLLIENDQSFVFFISLALLHLQKAKIMASDPSMAPQTLAGLTIETPEEYRRVLKKAYELRSKTPESFVYFIRGLDIFARNYSHDQIGIKKMHFNIEYLSYWEFFFMQPFEFIKYLNPRRIQCANLACPSNEKQQQQQQHTKKSSGQDAFSKTDDFNARGRKSFQEMSGLTNDTALNSKLECEFCTDKFRRLPKELQMQIQAVPHMREVVSMSTALSRQELEFLIIDLRIERDHDDGIMPKSQIFDIKNFNEDSVSKLMDDLIELRNNFHFCFMIDCFESANIQSTRATENDSSEILRRFVNYFIDNNFSHISILEGGFKAIHDMSLRMNSDILFHNQSKCRTCQGKNSEEWNIGNSLMSLFNQVFRDTSKKITDFRLFTEVSPKNPKINP